MAINPTFWKNKTVFLTGHTGFKGGWIAHWLYELGAAVHGYALEPPTQPNFFTETQLQKRLAHSTVADIRDFAELTNALNKAKPDIIIHMAAQSLVRDSYNIPSETFAANVMGTVNLLEAARQTKSAEVILNITSDKCYENKEWPWPYRENDRLGGHDPYSASKACAEIAAAAYHNSFLAEANIYLSSVRAGNVIGGGDWAPDRLIPDFFRAVSADEILNIRSPNAVRPWQHVLEPISGYLMLAEKLYIEGSKFAEAWNFGPNEDDARPVSWIVDQLCNLTSGAKWQIKDAQVLHEANLLMLDSSKAKSKLGWTQRWDLESALNRTVEWHQAWCKQEDMASVTTAQIQAYTHS